MEQAHFRFCKLGQLGFHGQCWQLLRRSTYWIRHKQPVGPILFDFKSHAAVYWCPFSSINGFMIFQKFSGLWEDCFLLHISTKYFSQILLLVKALFRLFLYNFPKSGFSSSILEIYVSLRRFIITRFCSWSPKTGTVFVFLRSFAALDRGMAVYYTFQ